MQIAAEVFIDLSQEQHLPLADSADFSAHSTMSTIEDDPQGATASANSIERKENNPQTRNTGSPLRNIHVRVAHAGPRQRLSCRLLAIDAENQGVDLLIKLRQIIKGRSTRISRFLITCQDAFLMRRDSVWVVSVYLVSSNAAIDVEKQIVDPIVYIDYGECSKSLTRALHHPAHLEAASNFVLHNLEAVVGDNSLAWTEPKQALYLRKGFSRKVALVWFCVALALSVVIGLGAGLAKRDLHIGFAVGTGMLTVLADVQCVLFWQISTANA